MRLDMVLYSTEESDSIAADVNEQTLLKKKKWNSSLWVRQAKGQDEVQREEKQINR